ncbi:MAG: NAD-dependent epimerase/dehydratase family protein, partial [Candidatus Thalassarchaeaceae archaeon]
GSMNLLRAMIEENVKNIIFSSSAAVYGLPEYLPLDEKHPLKPINHYGYTKLQTEKTIDLYGKEKQISYTNLRYFNAAGYDALGRITSLEKNPANLIPSVMEVASGKRNKLLIYGNDFETIDGTGVRDYIHVSDLARAHLAALHLISAQQSTTLNLGSEKQYSVMEVIRSAEKITGKRIPYEIVDRREGDPDKIYASTEKAQNLLKWSAEASELDNIIETTWRIYK